MHEFFVVDVTSPQFLKIAKIKLLLTEKVQWKVKKKLIMIRIISLGEVDNNICSFTCERNFHATAHDAHGRHGEIPSKYRTKTFLNLFNCFRLPKNFS